MGWPFVKRRMRAELGPGWEAKFASFSHEAGHAASLGQVHRATLHDGREVACKLQYPDMSSAVESDVGQLRTLLGVFKRMDGSIDADAMVEEITDRLREELDALCKTHGYIGFWGDSRNYALHRVGQSLQYDVPPNKRGWLAPLRGQRVRIICLYSGPYRRWLRAGPIWHVEA